MPITDTKGNKKTATAALANPDLYPDEFKAWIPRSLTNNPNFTVDVSQLPRTEAAHAVGATGEPAFQNSWANYASGYQPLQFYRDVDRVYIEGLIKSGTVGTVIFTLPSGYLPPLRHVFVTMDNGAAGRVDVLANGDVQHISPADNTYVSLSGISFRRL